MKKNRAACIFLLDGAGQWSYVPVISKGNQARLREIRPMNNHQTTAARMYRNRRAMERAAGLLLIERIEAGATLSDLQSITGPIGENGLVKGTDMGPISLVALCGASRARKSRALAALKA